MRMRTAVPPQVQLSAGGGTAARALARVAAPLALFLACGSLAAQVLINPVFVEFGERQRIASVTVTLSEKATAPMRLQAEMLRWDQDIHGAALTQPSGDMLVTPAIADLKPGDKQVFRLALRGPRPAPGELAYRLILEDIAAAPANAAAAGAVAIQFRMRYDLPVLIAPAVPVQTALRWKSCAPAAAGEACVALRNAGNRRVKVRTLMLAGADWHQEVALNDGVNVLAGATRAWRVPPAAGHAGAVRGVQVRTARDETLQAEPDN